VELLDETLDTVVGRLVRNRGHIGVSLTGGWDGRLLLAYALKHIPKEQVMLYSFGTEDAPDVTIPRDLSQKLGFRYFPIYLDDQYLQNKYLEYAAKTVYNSDALRSIKRAHYLFAMDFLSGHVPVILTGIAGSNLLKSSSYTPGNVFNKYVLNLIETTDRETELKAQLAHVHATFGELFRDVTANDFIASFDMPDLNDILAIPQTNERFCTYLISNIERKYFGPELNSYKHLITNFSPFLDYDFIKALLKTTFFGGYNQGKSYTAMIYNTLLYARLISRNSPELAAEPTDRGFSMSQIMNPLKYGSLAARYVKAKSRARSKTTSDYKTDRAAVLFNERYDLGMDELVKLEPTQAEFISNYLSQQWFQSQMSNQP
jgi:hypothetical protein